MNKFSTLDIYEIKIPSISSYFWKNKEYSFDRICKIFLFYRYLYKYNNFRKIDKITQHNIIRNLEKGCYNNTKKIAFEKNITYSWEIEEFTYIYHTICGRILSYLSTDHTNPIKISKFIDEFISNKEKSINFCNTTHKDLYPDLYIKAKKRQSIEQNIAVKSSKLRTCPKCKHKLSTTKNRYARSLDEGVDLTATCVFCGYSWAC